MDLSSTLNKKECEVNTFAGILTPVRKVSAIAELILRRMGEDELDLSYRDLARLSGGSVSFASFNNFTNPDNADREWNPELSTILGVAKAINVPPTVVFDAFMGTRTEGNISLRADSLKRTLAEFESLSEKDRQGLGLETFSNEVHRRAARAAKKTSKSHP